MMISFNLVYALASGPAGSLSDRLGRRRLILGGWLIYGAIYLGFTRVTAGWQAWALMTPYGLYYALTEGVAKAYVADLVPADRRGHAYGVYNAAVGLAALPASLIAGVLWQGLGPWNGFGPAGPFYFGAAWPCSRASSGFSAFRHGRSPSTLAVFDRTASWGTNPIPSLQQYA